MSQKTCLLQAMGLGEKWLKSHRNKEKGGFVVVNINGIDYFLHMLWVILKTHFTCKSAYADLNSIEDAINFIYW